MGSVDFRKKAYNHISNCAKMTWTSNILQFDMQVTKQLYNPVHKIDIWNAHGWITIRLSPNGSIATTASDNQIKRKLLDFTINQIRAIHNL